jgi:hypothetical protein
MASASFMGLISLIPDGRQSLAWLSRAKYS